MIRSTIYTKFLGITDNPSKFYPELTKVLSLDKFNSEVLCTQAFADSLKLVDLLGSTVKIDIEMTSDWSNIYEAKSIVVVVPASGGITNKDLTTLISDTKTGELLDFGTYQPLVKLLAESERTCLLAETKELDNSPAIYLRYDELNGVSIIKVGPNVTFNTSSSGNFATSLSNDLGESMLLIGRIIDNKLYVSRAPQKPEVVDQVIGLYDPTTGVISFNNIFDTLMNTPYNKIKSEFFLIRYFIPALKEKTIVAQSDNEHISNNLIFNSNISNLSKSVNCTGIISTASRISFGYETLLCKLVGTRLSIDILNDGNYSDYFNINVATGTVSLINEPVPGLETGFKSLVLFSAYCGNVDPVPSMDDIVKLDGVSIVDKTNKPYLEDAYKVLTDMEGSTIIDNNKIKVPKILTCVPNTTGTEKYQYMKLFNANLGRTDAPFKPGSPPFPYSTGNVVLSDSGSLYRAITNTVYTSQEDFLDETKWLNITPTPKISRDDLVALVENNKKEIDKIKESREMIKPGASGDIDFDSILQYIDTIAENLQSNIHRVNRVANEYTQDVAEGIQRQLDEINRSR